MVLVLFETAGGLALFKVLQEGKLKQTEDVSADFGTLEQAQKMVKLKAFSKFQDTTEAMEAATALVDSKLSKPMKKFLRKNVDGEELAILDKKLGGIVQEKLGIPCVYSNAVLELTRGIRNQLQGLISGLSGVDLKPMSLGLSHSLSRYKLKFSPDKVDTMIVQAIGLLDDLDKELNTYAMRVREWYGWHFPEMTKIVNDNIAYAKVVKLMGTRDQAASHDFSGIIEEDTEQHLKDAAIVSMGTEISQEDLMRIRELADQVIDLYAYRGQLFDYLKSRMNAIAPNLTVLVGELVGARLISHAGSLINLAKQPASTVQILGAEKALFRALKTKHETPKYGLIYHASLIGQSSSKYKGKVSRVLAAKCALATRVDALGEGEDAQIGIDARSKVEARLRQLEGKTLITDGGKAKGKEQPAPYDKTKQQSPAAGLSTVPKAYNADADVAVPEKKKKKKDKSGEQAGPSEEQPQQPQQADGQQEGEQPKKKKKEKKAAEAAAGDAQNGGGGAEEEAPKKKKKKAEAGAADGGAAEEAPKKKKKKAAE
uniref:MAR-binding protein n=1 Tax=Dunaliella salina TaxID=3046 RepID=B1PZ65_DUNSA|nr:MAR-binding protein [Dunaliella salina]